MDPRLQPLAAIFALNTDLVGNCAADLSDAQANRRLKGGGNSIAFLIAHLTDVRHFLADLLGSPIANPLTPYLAEARSIDEVESLPPLTELLDAWRVVSAHLADVFEGMDATALDAATPQSFPTGGGTMLDTIAFLAQHDSYHLGQIAFLRRRLGLPAMTYERAEPDGA